MAIHTELPIYRTGLELLNLAVILKRGHAVDGLHLEKAFRKHC